LLLKLLLGLLLGLGLRLLLLRVVSVSTRWCGHSCHTGAA
jgi:hypothetical protein